jgi:hypothetical protein
MNTFTLSALEMLNPTEVLPKICKSSPVRGLRPRRAADFFCLKVPNSRRRISLPFTSTYVEYKCREGVKGGDGITKC